MHPETFFRVLGPRVDLVTGCSVPGRYNVANALLALAILRENSVPADVAAAAIDLDHLHRNRTTDIARQALFTFLRRGVTGQG